MRKQILATTTALALAADLTSSAMARDHKAESRRYTGHFAGASGEMHDRRGRQAMRFAGGGGPERQRHGGLSYGGDDRGGFVDLGPLGITTACGSYRYGHDDCGSGYGTPIDAWSR